MDQGGRRHGYRHGEERGREGGGMGGRGMSRGRREGREWWRHTNEKSTDLQKKQLKKTPKTKKINNIIRPKQKIMK